MFLPRVFKQLSRTLRLNFSDSNLVGYSIIITLSIIVLANFLGISIVLGALVAGMALVRAGGNRMDFVRNSISSFSHSFLIPIYFALVGLRIELSSTISLALMLQVLILTSTIKIVSVAIVARLTFKRWTVALDYGISMNARGGPGIILASLAFEAKIIDSALFTTFVFVSLMTSATAGLWLRWRKSAI
jgi:Kef-type K+ transport system membrane component KefB